MKLKKFLFVFFTAFISIFLYTGVGKAALTYVTIPGTSEYVFGRDYLNSDSTWKFTLKKVPITASYSDYFYCTDSSKEWYDGTDKGFTKTRNMDSKMAYLLNNGYPNKNIVNTGDDKKDYFITALAVYYLLGDSITSNFVLDTTNYSNSTYRGEHYDVAAYVAELVGKAQGYTSNDVSISVNSSSNGFTLSNDKKYYVSEPIGLTTVGVVGNYTVSLSGAPSGTIVTDTNGNTKNTFSPTAKFLVKVPVSNITELSFKADIEVSASGTQYFAYEYECGESNIQSIVHGEKLTNIIKSSISLSKSITTNVEISKVDVTNSQELAGAHLVVKDANGNIVDEWTSDGTVHRINGSDSLAPGTYTLTETIAPEGYVLSTETITFDVKADGVTVKKTMKNYPKDDVYISKVDATTGEELPGAKLVLKNSKGKVVDEWVSESTPHKVKVKLPAGKYTLTETIAPDGYKKSTETITFTVLEDGSVKEPVIMKNSLKDDVYISKQDATTGKELPGAKLVLKDSNGNVLEEWVSEDTPHKVKIKLAAGKYTLTETIAPDGYELSTETVEFTVEEDGSVKEPVIMKNDKIVEPVPTGDSLIYAIWVIGMAAIGYSIYYFNKLKKETN